MFQDLDAIELLTLYGIFERSLAAVARQQQLRPIDQNTVIAWESELIALKTEAYIGCVNRCRSISIATEFITITPPRSEQRADAMEPLF
jgi:hypothetical protein